ncbi:DUF4433 domain-containing protein [Cryptosporangium phraense]|uniref:DUF4433 domain-containing protein n=1 Tax=Cryptosporangium phraense TaxID=2593070 RepID=A0A545AQZ2_9ACTN|nr:DUF4433 domain-containing protein [Cryptosporangium phraense]TQS43750.1 DUF4433 domain-containing protein [Cryptosporangium phraense]
MTRRTRILHFTHEDNLVQIFGRGGLVCDKQRRSSGIESRNVAYSDLKLERSQTIVEVPPGGTLDDYVPFYFGPKSPMMLTYMNGNVTGSLEDLNEIVYFVSSAQHVEASGLKFAFTDGHPVKQPRFFYNDLADLGEVDHALMWQKWWHDTDEYPDRKRRRQAEFLVWREMPLTEIDHLVTKSHPKRLEVESMLSNWDLDIPCRAWPSWYY